MRTCVLLSFCLLLFCCKDSTSKESLSTEIKDIDISEVLKYMNENKNFVLLDVRTAVETKEGKITSDATEIDFYGDNFREEIRKLDKTKTYLVYCRSGKRSSSSQKIMVEEGFEKVYNILGGYLAWEEQNSN